jgi:hypothetical protein
MRTTNSKCMKTQADADPSEIRPPHLPYSAFCLAARDQTTWVLTLLATAKKADSFCPAKQPRALLESNPPRDNWIERRRNKTVPVFGEARTSPKQNGRHLFQSLSMPHKTHPKHKLNTKLKTTLTGTRFFEASATSCLFFRGKPSARLKLRYVIGENWCKFVSSLLLP